MGSIESPPSVETSDRPAVLTLFEQAKRDGRPINVSAPMVRYSKLPFRMLVKDYGADIIFTPMMLAHEFVRSSIARDSDFSTHPLELLTSQADAAHDTKRSAVIAQFASSDPEEFARAAEMISPWVDGVDLNCGCPQSWAIKEGIGCALQDGPDLVASIVRAAKSRLGPTKSVSVKIRIHKDLSRTKHWIETVQEAGVDFITIHGRTRIQRSSTPPDYEAICFLSTFVTVPLIANGDAYTLSDVKTIALKSGAQGVMAARGILENPAMFHGHDKVPEACLRDFMRWAVRCPIPFTLVLHHVSEMTARMPDMGKKEKRSLMESRDMLDLLDFVEAKWGLGST